MSLEALFLIAVFVLFPLLQQLLQAARERAARPPEQAGRPPTGTPRAPAHLPPPTVAIPSQPDGGPHAMSGTLTALAPASGRSTGARVSHAPTPHGSARRGAAAAGLRTRLGLRRAIALAAILGPGRADSPYEWPERARRQ